MHEQDTTKRIMVIMPDQRIIDVEIGPGTTAADLKKELKIPLHMLLYQKTIDGVKNIANNVDLYVISHECEQYIIPSEVVI